MIGYEKGRILLDGKPVTLLSGEVHYFRLQKSQWRGVLQRLKECGMNAVATYVPWIVHEYREGQIDVSALEEFITLCESEGLFVLLRPGPFIMAEMKNEGIPDWIYEKCPGALPEGQKSRTLDYLDPAYLSYCKRWYAHVLGMAARHTQKNGGRLIVVQLDNEIGMLEWVTHTPSLTEGMRADFLAWYGKPYEKGMESALSRFMRARYRKYVETLISYAKDAGMTDVLYMINIHGTGEGRGLTYPVGVSQLEEAIAGDNIIAGSDVYFDGFTMQNFTDMVLDNGITLCANAQGKPLCSMEFNCGDNNFGDDLMVRIPAYAGDFTTRLFLACGNRLMNYYLFCGGVNGRLPDARGDGNDRFSFTGEYHGYAAPIGPDGTPNQTWPRFQRVLWQMSLLGDKLADSMPDTDPIAFCYNPDYYAHEFAPDLEDRNRDGGCWDETMRALLLLNVKPATIHLRKPIPDNIKCLVMPSCRRMAKDIQEKLAFFLFNGGSLLLHGRIPTEDEEGRPCEILKDALDIEITGEYAGGRQYYDPAVKHVGALSDFREFHASDWQSVDPKGGEALLQLYENSACCGFYKQIGKGRAVVLLTQYKCYLSRYEKILELLGVSPSLRAEIQTPGRGVYMLNTVNTKGEGFLFVLNLDDVEKTFPVSLRGESWLDGNIHLPAQEAMTLPRNCDFGCAKVVWSSAELLDIRENALIFRNTEKESLFCFDRPPKDMPYEEKDGKYIVRTDNRLRGDGIEIAFQ